MNGDSAEKLVQSLRRYFPGRRKTFIFGVSSDHPVDHMLAVLLPVSDQTLVTASRHHRAERPENLAAMAAERGYQVTMTPDVSSALDKALNEAGQEDLICVTGSLFLVADAREAWLRRCGLPLPPIDPLILS
jgi:dihydrofolate synthase/folylpolyglutamate synthase